MEGEPEARRGEVGQGKVQDTEAKPWNFGVRAEILGPLK